DDGETGIPWRITGWHTKELESAVSSQLWFKEAVEEALPRTSDRSLVRRSEHHEAAIEFYNDGAKRVPHPYFSAISANQKPGISIADIDSDGDDDIYIMVRLGKNRLLENRGDGTFVEAAATHGLDIPGHTTCAIFADFDNDGDADLMLGRSLLPSKYMENNGGWFSERELILPKLAISMSAADYNRDGLLDLYIATYRPAVLGGSSPAGGVAAGSSDWPDEFLFPEVAKEYYRRHEKLNRKDGGSLFPNLLNQLGPPNALLVNRGDGKFEPAPENSQLGIWRNTLQATWCDYDEDGDPDLYIANDWAPDHLFRNDGVEGFADVTDEAGTSEFGFAMGATWGDYDNDGRHDL
ncbi:MAG: VCBS repeat-containing protein, partial [Phycisphaerales bacterium]|nr:VCBS repeat-containing protein [Phycisphaerales bacterium]